MVAQIKLPEQNIALIAGRLTKDANVAYTQKGQAVCRFDVAVNRRYLDQNSNEWKDDVVFVPVVLWGPSAERSKDRLKKGVPVSVEGRITSSEYTDKNTGQTRKSLQITARRVQILQWQEAGAAQASSSTEDSGAEESLSIDDDVPF